MDAIESSARADLAYVNDAEPGLRRRRAGRGFVYLDARGRRIDDCEVLSRIRALAIPPAWTEVWICADPHGHIQAAGRDLRGRKQYRYHPGWTACRDEAKFASLAGFGALLPRLRENVDHDLRRRGLPVERVLASVIYLLDTTLIRIGNDIYAEANKSFGLTTLRARHLKVDGSELRFSFTGKSGQQWQLRMSDRRIASVIRRIQDLPGQRLFRYLDENGEARDIRSQDVNDYIRGVMGPEYSSRHFRTWGATVEAAMILSKRELPGVGREQKVALNSAIDRVARRLHNTRAVCRRCYIHPAVIDAWLDRRLCKEMASLHRRPALKGLDRDESGVYRWLKRQAPMEG